MHPPSVDLLFVDKVMEFYVSLIKLTTFFLEIKLLNQSNLTRTQHKGSVYTVHTCKNGHVV